MKKTYSTAALTSGLVLLLSSVANAACSPVDCAALGYNKTETACEGQKILRCPFDAAKVNCLGKNCMVGDVYYSDGFCDADFVSGKTPVGIVGYITNGGKHGGVIALEEKSLAWSNVFYNVPCLPDLSYELVLDNMNGLFNTQCIMSQTNDTYPAAKYCNSYKPVSSGKGSTGWYLPAAGELRSLSYNYEVINLGLSRLSRTNLSPEYYWSSSEYSTNAYRNAWYVNSFDSNMAWGQITSSSTNKTSSFRVRCFLAF